MFPKINVLNFEEVDYIDQKGQFRKAYQMTKDGFMFLVMGFTGKKAAEVTEAYINAFNQMGNQLCPTHPTLPPFAGNQLPNHTYPNFYDSGGYRLTINVANLKPIGHTTSNST